jgi:hypothetical protein
MASMMLTMAM